jgi:hypothetical protein
MNITFFKAKITLNNMRIRSAVWGGLALVSLCLLIGPALASGAYTTIQQGGTVFIGEQGLDITSALGTTDSAIGWWASGAAIATSSPDSQMPITSRTDFYVSPSAFGQYTGNWYRLNAQGKEDGIAFVVADPSLAVRIIDTTVSIDMTNKWIPRGDQAVFEIDTNLNPLFTRGSSSTEGIDLYVQAPSGGVYSALLDSSGIAHPLSNLIVSSPTYQTPWSWDTGNSQYVTGTYTIWAKCDINGMYDNYGMPGKTISQQVTILDQEQNPLISANVPATVTTTQSNAVQTSKTQNTPLPTTLPTTVVTTPLTVVPTTTAPVTAVATTSAPVESTTAKASGFGAFLTMVSIVTLTLLVFSRRY